MTEGDHRGPPLLQNAHPFGTLPASPKGTRKSSSARSGYRHSCILTRPPITGTLLLQPRLFVKACGSFGSEWCPPPQHPVPGQHLVGLPQDFCPPVVPVRAGPRDPPPGRSSPRGRGDQGGSPRCGPSCPGGAFVLMMMARQNSRSAIVALLSWGLQSVSRRSGSVP